MSHATPQSEIPPSQGYIHFDVTQGCTAELLISALLALHHDTKVVQQAFLQAGITDIHPHLSEIHSKNRRSYSLEFRDENNHLLQWPEQIEQSKYRSTKKHAPKWDHPKNAATEIEIGTASSGVAIAGLAKIKEAVSTFEANPPMTALVDADSWLKKTQLDPILHALIRKTWKILAQSLHESHGCPEHPVVLPQAFILKMQCEVVAFCALLTQLDPSVITASILPISSPPLKKDAEFDAHSWLLTITSELPTYERAWPAPYSDVVGAALLKAIAASFGARGDSCLFKMGVGLPRIFIAHSPILCRALLCKNKSTRLSAQRDRVEQVQAELAPHSDLQMVKHQLTMLGATSLRIGFSAADFACPTLSLLLPASSLQQALHIIFTIGGAKDATTSSVERHSLSQREIAVPYGRGQTEQQCRITEWMYGEDVVRVEPNQDDIAIISQKTGFSHDAIRSDVMSRQKRL